MDYLQTVLQKYQARSIINYPQTADIAELKLFLTSISGTCYSATLDSGSRAKNTAINISSDVDYLVSLTSNCSNSLEEIFNHFCKEISNKYLGQTRIQNVSVRIKFANLEVDITPAKMITGYTNYHYMWLSKDRTIKQTNIQIHINDVKNSGRTDEIKLTKIWRELNNLEFTSIYIEYLIIEHILKYKNKGDLVKNFWYILNELAKDVDNPLSKKIIDPANTNNILSDLLTNLEKSKIIIAAKLSITKTDWKEIIY